MNRSKALIASITALFLGLGSAGHATDVVWKHVTYHDAVITSTNGDKVLITGTRDSDGATATFQMPLSSVPDEVIQDYRATHNQPGQTVERPLTAKEAADAKAALALRDAKLANLKAALALDHNHPVIVAGHILLKSDEGVVIVCDASTPPDLPQCTGTVFLRDCPGVRKLHVGDPVAAIGYSDGQYLYNFQNIQAFKPPKAQ